MFFLNLRWLDTVYSIMEKKDGVVEGLVRGTCVDYKQCCQRYVKKIKNNNNMLIGNVSSVTSGRKAVCETE